MKSEIKQILNGGVASFTVFVVTIGIIYLIDNFVGVQDSSYMIAPFTGIAVISIYFLIRKKWWFALGSIVLGPLLVSIIGYFMFEVWGDL